jgi:hypothetical protein
MHHGPAEVQQEALRALATLTDAAQADPVLQAVRAVQASATALTLQALAASTASALMRRFGAHAVDQSPASGHGPASDMALSRLASPSLLQEVGERYRVIRTIGQGGFGTVVLVEDLMVHEQLILKFLFPHLAADARMIARLGLIMALATYTLRPILSLVVVD